MYLHTEFSFQGILALFFLLLTKCFKVRLEKLRCYNSLRKKFESLNLTLKNDLSNHVIIVTGSNTGIGRETSLRLAELGATVVLACRDEQKGRNAAGDINTRIQSLPHHGKAVYMKLDLSDLHSVLEFSKVFKATYSRLDVLVNNAGLNSDGLLANGLQQLFQVNYLGHYLLVRSLEDALRCSNNNSLLGEFSSPMGRIVNLSSCMHHGGQPNFKVSALRKFSRFMKYKYSYYSDSKLYMNLLTLEINKRYFSGTQGKSKRPVVAISANPGAVSSDIWRNYPCQKLYKAVTSLVFLNVKEGCDTSVFAAAMSDSCLDSYLRRFSVTEELRAGMSIRKDVPYLIPYCMPFPCLAFELFGEFVGARWGAVSLPNCSSIKDTGFLGVSFSSPEDLSTQLWEYSAELCKRILIQSGTSLHDLSFLDVNEQYNN